MKKAFFILLLPTLLLLNLNSTLAQETPSDIEPKPEGEKPTVVINEIAPSPRDPDFTWIELHNTGADSISLNEWTLLNSTSDSFELSGNISANQYQVIILDDGFISADDELILADSNQDIIDHWTFLIDLQDGQSIILENDILVATSFPTAGRPNILEADQELQCSSAEDLTNIDLPPITSTPAVPTPKVLDTAGIIISELLANPSGDEKEGEFIELYNPENRLINLEQWTIKDATKSYTFSDLEIQPHAYIVLPRSLTSIALNNGVETLTLIDPYGKIIHEMNYESTTEDKSWNYVPIGHWYQANSTPGLENNAETIEIEEPEDVLQIPPVEIMPEEEISQPAETAPLDSNLHLVELSEILPNPAGSDTQEWLELHNPTDETILLTGLSVSDTAKSFVFTDQTIGPGEFYLLHRSESTIALNNSSETITLSVGEIIIDEFSYEISHEQTSWAQVNGEWIESSTLTPGEENIISSFEEAENEESPIASAVKKTSSKSKNKTINHPPISFEEWEKTKDEELIEIVGILTVLPGTFSSRSAYLQNIDDHYPLAIELYFHKANWPQLNIGDQLKIQGEKSMSSRGERLLIKSEENIVLITEGQVYFTDIKDSLNHTLIRVEATLIEQNKNELIIDIDGEEALVDLKKAKINLADIKENAKIKVTGIVKYENSKPLLIVRSKDDIDIISQPTIISSIQEEIAPPQVSASNYSNLIWLAIGSILASLIALLIVHHQSLLQKARDLLFQFRHKYNI